MKGYKVIISLLSLVSILLIILFSLFFVLIYQDYTNTEQVSKSTEKNEVIGTVMPVLVPDENEEIDENKHLIVEPTIREEFYEEEIAINTDKFYYNQLDDYSKLIYKSLEGQKEKLKTGNNIIELPDKLGEIIETTNAQAIFSIAANAFEYDNPDVFYLDISKLTLYYQKDNRGNYKIYINHNEGYSNYLIDSFSNKQQVETAESNINNIVEQIENQIQGMDIQNKIRYIHDWLVGNIKYDETLNKSNRSNIYGAFIEKEITCAGYAKAFKYIVDKLNIECIIVQGTATSNEGTENHAWNYIQLNNKWYGVDCTWDDPIIIGGNENDRNKIYYTYYLKGQNVFNDSHKTFGTFYSTNVEINYPELEQNDYN